MAAVGVLLLGAAIISQIVNRSFWQKDSLLASLGSDLVIIVISAGAVSEWLQHRARRRWNLLAQNVMFSLVQCARMTWTSLLAVLEVDEESDHDAEGELRAHRIQIALDRDRLITATGELLGDPGRRARLQKVVGRLSEHTDQVIAAWAGVMMEAPAYVNMLDRHVELQGRLDWMAAVLTQHEPSPDLDRGSHRRTSASVAVERVGGEEVGWLRDMIVATTVLAATLDRESRDLAFSLASPEWWQERTTELIEGE
jgi:hypothetical protein